MKLNITESEKNQIRILYSESELKIGDIKFGKGTKSTVTDIDPETGAVSWKIESAPDFLSVYKIIREADDFLDSLSKVRELRHDEVLRELSGELGKLFRQYRNHIRTEYPKEYENLRDRIE